MFSKDAVFAGIAGQVEDVELTYLGDGLFGLSQAVEDGPIARVILTEGQLEALAREVLSGPEVLAA